MTPKDRRRKSAGRGGAIDDGAPAQCGPAARTTTPWVLIMWGASRTITATVIRAVIARMTDDETFFIGRGDSDVYHTDRECKRLACDSPRNVDGVFVERSSYDECAICAGAVERGGQDSAHYEALKRAAKE